MKHLDDIPDPTLEDLNEMEAEFDLDSPDDLTYEDFDRFIGEATTTETRREAMHRNARDMTRIEHDTVWAFLSGAGSFLPRDKPKKERDNSEQPEEG